MENPATLILAAFGLACIYAGYRLFCGLPSMNKYTRPAVFLMNVVPGALLALFGTFLITTQARAMVSHRPAIQRHQPAAEGTSWHPGAAHHVDRSA
jgi:hypothetical protein